VPTRRAHDLAAASTPVEDSRDARFVNGLRGIQILVIDDELDARTLLTDMLEEFGCRVLAARSGEEGLRMAREYRPRLITVDLMMPSLHGTDVVRAIKGDPALRSIPVIVVSVVAAENRGQILGEVDVLEKPIQRDELLAVIQRNISPVRPRILVVDDEDDARHLMVTEMRDDAEVDTARNGQEALAKLDQADFDLVLLDLMMPVMDGMKFLDALRAHPRHRHISVVVVTAKELTKEEISRLQCQTQAVLKKAETFEINLKHTLHRLLDRGRGGAEADGTLPPSTNNGMAS
jgi:CheY-like chemotaxis protein